MKALTMLLACLPALAFAEMPGHSFFDRPILLGAHRGGAQWGPESTAETYRRLVETYPDALCEADARVTKDGHVVILHDDTVDRTTNGTGKITDMTLVEAQALDVAYRWTPDKGETYPYRGKGFHIPTMAEAFAAAPDNAWMVEIKAAPLEHADIIAREILRLGMADRVILASFDPALLNRANKAAPEIAICYDSESRKHLLDALRGPDWHAYEPEAQMLTLGYNRLESYGLTPDDFPKIRAKGIPICVWTVNREETMREVLGHGVDSILTDRPDLLHEILESGSQP